MKKLLSILALLLAALAVPAAAQPQSQSWTGHWHGTLVIQETRLRLIVTIADAPGGGLTGQMESIDQAPGQKLPMESLAVRGGIGEYAEIEETMAPVVLATVAAWIRTRFAGRPR